MVLGNTGAGKSTAINYIDGFEMILHEKTIVVNEKKSKRPALMKIGHKESQTLLPQIEVGSILAYIDCPGFKDTRGPIINIANTINIKNATNKAKSVIILVLLNVYSLLADRERGLNDMIKILQDLFGYNLKSSMESILIGITHIDSYGNSTIQHLDDIKQIFAKHENAKDFIDRVITFNPLEKPLKGGLKREQLLLCLKNLKPIADCKSIFNTVLLDSDKVELTQISREITERLKKDLGVNISSITANNFKSSAENFKLLQKLEIIQHSEINEHLKINKELIMKKLNDIVMEFRERCSRFEFWEADRIYSILSTSLPYYDDDDIKKTVNLSNLQTYRYERASYKQQ